MAILPSLAFGNESCLLLPDFPEIHQTRPSRRRNEDGSLTIRLRQRDGHFCNWKDSVMSDWIIRECRAEEAEAVLALWREAGASPSVTDSVADIRRAILQSPARFLVAEAGGKLI